MFIIVMSLIDTKKCQSHVFSENKFYRKFSPVATTATKSFEGGNHTVEE